MNDINSAPAYTPLMQALLNAGYVASADIQTDYALTEIFTARGAQVSVTQEVVGGALATLSLSVKELDAFGWASGIEHNFSHVTTDNVEAIAGFVAAVRN